MKDIIPLVAVIILGLIGLGIFLTLAFWAMNNLGLLIIILIVLGIIYYFYSDNLTTRSDNNDIEKNIRNESYSYSPAKLNKNDIKKLLDDGDYSYLPFLMIDEALEHLIKDNIHRIVNFSDIDFFDAEQYAYYYGIDVHKDLSNARISFRIWINRTEYLVFFARKSDSSTMISIEPKSKWDKIAQNYNS